ncbi:DEHA2G08030p [Debaryomyces hansenii CBS767]|uniref:DEHA2G08030p n=1 Tax=Debaryomyces hansenii (strain ATCC 36239 / CBS 767 / BCRC 21394 / JCM 1990 / NBRC 0083 / IGC 2968) TaxID=284592 RepID=Q6BIS4_DEBHA|nr:DEHA2G08030p [Debaryomyces hansenii CBS767]CAG90360.2 DEHA2G08030p [Debaryomyces hansenii CBS767]|eukprot:XP_461897.2 DEHA2G08030p [Debaryomyces hansenii CBS767]
MENSSLSLPQQQLTIESILGTSAKTPDNFVIEGNLMAYTASGGVVVCQLDLQNNRIISQRFFCANSNGQNNNSSNPSSANAYLNMAYAEASNQEASSPTETVKDSYGFPISSEPVIIAGNGINVNGDNSPKGSDTIDLNSPSKLKERVRSINCLSLSPNNRVLAIGETGYQPRILLFSLAPDSNNSPIALIYEHSFGINSITFSPDSKYFCSLGLINDGFLNVWKLGNNSVHLQASNRCSSIINQVIWHENFIITLGLRLIKVWRFLQDTSNENEKVLQKPSVLKGKSVLLGSLINSNFISGNILNSDELLLIANSNQLLLLKLTYDSLKLICLETPKFMLKCLLVDYELGKVWVGSDDYTIKSLDFSDLNATVNPTSTQSPMSKINTMFGTTSLSPTKKELKSNSSILKLSNFNTDNLVYLSDSEEIIIYSKKNLKSEKSLVSSLMNDLSGIKDTFSNDLLVFSKSGLIKQVIDSETKEEDNLRAVIKFDLPSNELISNSLTAVDSNGEHLILGDKYGNIYITTNKINEPYEVIYSTKAHSSTINDIVYFKIGNTEFFSSISRDRMIQVFFRPDDESSRWDILQTLPLHTGNLLRVLFYDRKLYVCSSDRTISVHRFETDRDEIKIYQDKIISIKNSPINMKIIDNDLIISTNDRNMLIYSIKENLEYQRSIKLFNEKTNESLLVENFTIHKNLIIVASSDKSIRVFNYISGKPLSVSWGHSDAILSLVLKLNTNELISISIDGCLFKWNFNESSKKKSTGASNLNISPDIKFDSIPLYSKVTRKIIHTPATSGINSSSPFKPSLARSNSDHSSLQENETGDIDTTVSPTPPSRLSNATLKRLEAKKKAGERISPVRSNSVRSIQASPVVKNLSKSNTSLSPLKSSSTRPNTSPSYKKTIDLKGSPRKPLSSTLMNTLASPVKLNGNNQSEFMERSIAHLAMIKSQILKETISNTNKEILRKEINDISNLLEGDNAQIDKENQVLNGFVNLKIDDNNRMHYEEKLLENYSDKLVQIFQDKMKDKGLNDKNGIFTNLYSSKNYNNDVD